MVPVLSHADLRRRFEAVVFDWDGTAVTDRAADATRARNLVESLCAAGMEVAIVSGTHVGNVDGQLLARPRGAGRLHLLLNRGSEVFRVDAAGVHLVDRVQATADEDAALDEAAAIVVRRLAERGLEARIVSQRLNRRKIDIIPSPEWDDPPKARIDELLVAVSARLGSLGFDGLTEVVQLALDVAVEVGLPSPRVTSDVKHVEIGLTDKADSARWIYRDLWSRGIGPGVVLIGGDEFGPLGEVAGSDSLMLVPEFERATAVSVGVEPSGVPNGVIALRGGPGRFLDLLEDQLERRERGEVPVVDADPAWTITIDGLDPERERVNEALLTLSDGAVSTSGAPSARTAYAAPRVRAAGFYAKPGSQSELAPCPAWTVLPFDLDHNGSLRRTLDMRAGVLRQEISTPDGDVDVFQFSSLTRPGTVALRASGPQQMLEGGEVLQPPPTGAWASGERDGARWSRVLGSHSAIVATGAERGQPGGIDRYATYRRGGSTDDALRALAEAEEAGFDGLFGEHRARWAERWDSADVIISGDDDLQRAVRFSLFHLMAQVTDTGEAAVGARGMTGPAYRGHVFWDADVFVLPFLAATHPASARAMLTYRLNRLPAAVEAARARSRRGARFPWESAADGSEVTPASAREFTGRVVPIRTRYKEEHIVADIAWAADHYVRWSGDERFARGPGKNLWIETARYWASRCRWIGGAAHIFGVIGPDEYHDAVDDNAYTNVMARWNLRRAAAAVDYEVDRSEVSSWLRLADALVDGYDPDTRIYRQFDGFGGLEPLIISEMMSRPVVADGLLGRERVAGSQIIKQPDVLMMHHLVPEEVAPNSLAANLAFYEPRTAHGSSLSPAIHAALFARAGKADDGLGLLDVAAYLDLQDRTATTAGGLHLATMGAVWQALAFGYAGVRPGADALQVDPRLPSAWEGLEIHVRFHGAPVRIAITHDGVTVEGDAPVEVTSP